jgi:arylsulfatase A-like enzyme
MTSKWPASYPTYLANGGFAGQVTITELLHKNGYTTGHFGKWHIGPENRMLCKVFLRKLRIGYLRYLKNTSRSTTKTKTPIDIMQRVTPGCMLLRSYKDGRMTLV